MTEYIWLIPSFPAIGFILNGIFGKKIPRRLVSWIGCLSVFFSFLVSALLFFELLKVEPHLRVFETQVFDWIVSGDFKTAVGFRIDPLSIVMCLVVSGVGFLIHVYSTGYMHDDPGYPRYFTYLNLFVFMMLILVTANNVLLMFVGWEGVGLCSYLLIGFWYEKDSAANAGKKAFIVNRIGDYGFLLGMFLLVFTLAAKGVFTLNFGELQKSASLIDPNTAPL
jgi:NADH-quinone oxidoreductase subunit L